MKFHNSAHIWYSPWKYPQNSIILKIMNCISGNADVQILGSWIGFLTNKLNLFHFLCSNYLTLIHIGAFKGISFNVLRKYVCFPHFNYGHSDPSKNIRAINANFANANNCKGPKLNIHFCRSRFLFLKQ